MMKRIILHGFLPYRRERQRSALHTMKKQSILQAISMPWILRIGMKLIGLAPSYNRVGGTVTIEKIVNGLETAKVTAAALWEQMYFGRDEEV